MKRLAFSVCAFVALVGCGSSSDDGDGDGGPKDAGTPLDDVPQLYAAALCGAYERCIGPLFDLYLQGEDCLVRTTRRLEDDWPRIEDAVDENRIHYDGAAVEGCLDAIESYDCADLLEREDPACSQVLEGTIAAGAYCALNEECAGDLYCKSDSQCPGTCSEREASGADCESDNNCASGLVCSKVTQRCEEPAGAGDLCQQGHPDCAPGYGCAGASEDENRPGNCRTNAEIFAREAGESCDPVGGTLCTEGSVCRVDGVVPETGIVATCAARVGAGAACNLSFPSSCPTGQYCDVAQGMLEGTCQARPAAGEPCGREFKPDICAAYARCDGTTCRALAHLGDACTNDDVCYSEHCLNGKCAPSEGCE